MLAVTRHDRNCRMIGLIPRGSIGSVSPFPMPGRWTSYALACGSVVVGTLLSFVLSRAGGTAAAGMFALAVLIAALAGRGPGLVAAGLALAAYDFFFVDPPYALTLFSTDDGVALIIFVLIALFTGSLVHALRAERNRDHETGQSIAKLVAGIADVKRQQSASAMKQQLATHLAGAAGGPALVFDTSRRFGDPLGEALGPAVAERVGRMLAGESGAYFLDGWSIMSMTAAGGSPAAALWRSADGRLASPHRQLVVRMLVDFGAQAIARAELAGAMQNLDQEGLEPFMTLPSSLGIDSHDEMPAARALDRTGTTRTERAERDLLGLAHRAANKPTTRLGAGQMRRRAPWIATGAIAAAGLLAFFILPMTAPKTASVTYATTKGEHRTLVLADGTRMDLNAASRVSVQLDAKLRRVELLDGEAAFKVIHDTTRPFVVATKGGLVTDVGTEFDVRQRGRDFSVTVAQGIVDVRPTGATQRPPIRLIHGQRLSSNPTGDGLTLQSVVPEDDFGWRTGRLVLRERSLASVVAELNLYFAKPIRVTDPRLAEQRVSGVLMVNQEDGALRYLSSIAPMTIAQRHGEYFLEPSGPRASNP